MPGANTPNRGLPQIIGVDSPDVVRDLNALALALDSEYKYPAEATVLDVGQVGQVRAGRALTVADFTTLLGLSQPVGLWNLSDLTNLGTGGALVNKGAVPFAPGILGVAAQAAQFAGSTAQALYISDTGAADPFRLKMGSWGGWTRTAKASAANPIVTKWKAGGLNSYWLAINGNGYAEADVSVDGTAGIGAIGNNFIADDRWHFLVATWDGSALRLYVDGAPEVSVFNAGGIIAQTAAPLNIGGQGADGATVATNAHYGRVDETFVTHDVLSEDQVRLLYAAKVAHGLTDRLGAARSPSKMSTRVRRRRRGGPFVAGDFPAQPRRLHNFTAGALTDLGVDNQALANPNGAVVVAGADGVRDGAFQFDAVNDFLSATDALLPTTGDRTIGAWIKTTRTAIQIIATYGQDAGESAFRLLLDASGRLSLNTWTTNRATSSQPFNDGQWHFVAATYQASPADGLRVKLYADGRLVESQVAAVLTTVLAGATGFRIGASQGVADLMGGDIDGVFVCDSALTGDQIRALYAKGSQALPLASRDEGEHVEAIDATNLYVVHDSLEPQHQVDYAVAA